MAAFIIILILLLGLALIFVEVFVIPGTSLAGLLGGVALVVGVVLVYNSYGEYWGRIALAGSAVAALLAVYLGFRTIQSNKLAMKGEITGRVNELQVDAHKVGDKGTAVTELRPNGKAIFNDNKIEVYSTGEYIQRNSAVEIIKITNDKIFVKQT